MQFKKQMLTRAILATGVAVGLGLSQSAIAESADGTLNITAGLSEAMTVTCNSALSFGVTRVTTGDRDDATILTVDADNTTGSPNTTSGTLTDVTFGLVSPGSCTVSGSQADDTTVITVSFEPTVIELAGLQGAEGLDIPGTDISGLNVDSFTTTSGATLELTDGGTIFGIGGRLTIPNNLVAGNLGGYGAQVTVTVDDGLED
jgi:hypothetical protein